MGAHEMPDDIDFFPEIILTVSIGMPVQSTGLNE